MNKEKLKEILHDLNTIGYHKTNIVDLLGNEGIDNFNEISEFFEEMLNNPQINHRLETIQQGLNITGKDKYYEITHQEYLGRALGLKDGGLFNFYLNDFFVDLAKEFLETEEPELYNALFFIHGKGLPERSGSQKWHRDLEGLKILKIFMYCTEVGSENGPLEYVPKSFCGGDFPINEESKTMDDYQRSRILPSELEEQYCTPNAITFTGSPGDIIICNNTGFHRGGFIKEGFRCMTHALYVGPDAVYSPKDVNYDENVNFVDPNSQEYKNLGEKQKYLKISKSTNLRFSYGGINDSGGMRGGQISNKLTNSFEKLILNDRNIHDKNKIVIILKDWASNLELLKHLKNNGNKIILDVIDWLDVDKYNPQNNINNPNFFPDLLKEYYDGYIVNNSKMKEWWYENMDNDLKKPIFIIPHHWDERFANLPLAEYSKNPYFYYLGYRGHEDQNCFHVQKLLDNKLLYDDRSNNHGIPGNRYFQDRPVNGVQINIRKEGSWEYCFKPATKLSIAASMDSIMITTYDWSIQDILPEDYPYLLKSIDYEEVEKMFQYVKDTFEKEEWFKAKQMLEQVKEKTSLDEIIKLYLEIEKYFTNEKS